MFGNTFSHSSLRKYIIYFGKLFSNIYLNRYDQSGVEIQNMLIPINYGPHEKFLARAEGNPDLNRPIAIQLPRMSFEMAGFHFDSSRKFNKLNRVMGASADSTGFLPYQYSPVPYDILFNLYIMVKNAEDGTFIIEQILPFFTPEWNATLNINSDLGQTLDVPIIINDISCTDTYEGNFETRRALIWTLSFTIKGWLFGPTKTGGGGIIKDININFKVPPIGMTISDSISGLQSEVEKIDIIPGQTANGQPVNWYGANNASIKPSSVAANTIIQGSNYGFLIDFME